MSHASAPVWSPPVAAPEAELDVRGHMPVLDGWRGLAILAVVLHNGGAAMPADGSIVSTLARSILAVGWVGVSLFFVLSGFLITGILLDTRGSPGYLKNFYVRRTLRIFPLYYAALALILLLVPLSVAPGPWTESIERNQTWFWLYLQNWMLWGDGITGLGHFWSLAVEEQFYLAWPFVLLLAGGRWFPRVAIAVLVGAFASRVAMHFAGLSGEALYQSTAARADALAVGALLAFAVRDPAWRGALGSYRTRILLASTGALCVLAVLNKGLEPKDVEVMIWGQTLVALAFGALMIISLRPRSSWEHRLVRAVDVAWLRGLGKYSYAIYVFHFPLHLALHPYVEPFLAGGGPWGRVVRISVYAWTLLGLSTAVALLSWHGLEKWALRLKDRWAPRPAVVT